MELKRKTSNRLFTGMVLGILLGVVVAKLLGPVPGGVWEGFLARTNGAGEKARLVERVIDGDTIELKGGERIRYIGLDAPELGEPLYEEAKEFQEKVVLGSYVRIEACKEEPRDGYGRTLAFVYKGNVDVGEQLLRYGYARTLFMGRCGRAMARDYRKIERGAFLVGLGVWSLQDLREVGHRGAGRYVGCLMSVTGKVLNVHEGPKAFHLNFDKDYRTDFTAVLFRKDLARLVEEGLHPVTGYAGQVVKVTGIIKEYNGPQIIVESADQLALTPPTPGH
jgi:micrococcal nuclease